jgi:TonB-dependent receptor
MNVNTLRMELEKTPGATKDPSWKILPGFDFSYIRPVTKNFGFTISGAMSQKFNPQYLSTTTWTLNPDRTTGVENPYLSNMTMQDTPKFTDRVSGRVGFDWRFAPHDVITVGFSEQYYDAIWTGRRYNPSVGSNPAAFGRDFTQGRPNAGQVQFTSNGSRKSGTTWTPEFKYMHNGPVWKGEVRGAYSHSSNHMRDMEDRHFSIGTFTLGTFNAAGTVVAPTVRFENRGNYLPEVTTTINGEVVDSQDVNNFYLSQVGENYREAADVKKSIYYNLRRLFDPGFPLTVKVGGDVRQNIRDLRTYNPTYTFVGPDGRPNTRDNHVSTFGVDLVDKYSELDPPFGMRKFRWPSLYKLYDFFEAHRDWFTYDDAAIHRALVTGSVFVRETISSGFLRMDASFLQNRLTLVGGVRFQYYRVYSESGQVDNLGQYIHDEEGNIVMDPVTGQALRVSGTTYEITSLTNIERGVKTRSTTPGYYPSFNAIYRLTDNVQLRAGYASSVNYPSLSDVAGTTTVSDLGSNTNSRLVTANSPLKPWLGKNYDIDVEYYTPGGGAVTLAWFRKDIRNFVNQIRHESGTPGAKEALGRYGYGVLFPLEYDIIEKFNGGEARFTGWEFGFNQTLDPFVPVWSRGVHVFFNSSYKAAPRGVSADEVSAQSQRRFNWGTTLRRGRFTALLRWNHSPAPKLSQAPTATTSRGKSRTYMDLDLSFRLRANLSVFASAYNILSEAGESYYYTDNTPDYARRRGYNSYGVQCTVGLKGQF